VLSALGFFVAGRGSRMMTKATLTICLAGAVGSLSTGFGCLGWSVMTAEDVLIFPLVIGPYAVIAGLAWWRRSRRWMSLVLFIGSLLIAVSGFTMLGRSLYLQSSTPHMRLAMDLTPFVMCALQWTLTIVLVLVISLGAVIDRLRGTRAR
jgi:hypothetical protein